MKGDFSLCIIFGALTIDKQWMNFKYQELLIHFSFSPQLLIRAFKNGYSVSDVAFSCLGYIKRGEILHTKTSFIMLIVMLYAADQAGAVSAAELSNYRIMDYLAKRQSRSFLSYVIGYNSTISFESIQYLNLRNCRLALKMKY